MSNKDSNCFFVFFFKWGKQQPLWVDFRTNFFFCLKCIEALYGICSHFYEESIIGWMGRNPERDQTHMYCCSQVTSVFQPRPGPNCYVNASRTQVIPAGEPTWIDTCTKCRCHDGQDAGYWEGNRLATCSRLKTCNHEGMLPRKKWFGSDAAASKEQWRSCTCVPSSAANFTRMYWMPFSNFLLIARHYVLNLNSYSLVKIPDLVNISLSVFEFRF